MAVELDFAKGHGTENDFVIVQDVKAAMSGLVDGRIPPTLVRSLCDRHTGIGADGLLRIVPAALHQDSSVNTGRPLPQGAEVVWFMDYYNADGSTGEMNTQTRVSVEYSRQVRAIRLLQGEAFFSVARVPNKPFRVFVGSTVVEAVGTQFSIFKDADSTRVAVVEGRVAVAQASTQATPALLAANQAAQITTNGMVNKTSNTDVRTRLSWREHRLSFDNDTIADVVAQFSRYSDAKIVLDGDVGKRRISGSCSLDPDSLLVFLENDPSVQVNRVSGGAIVRPR